MSSTYHKSLAQYENWLQLLKNLSKLYTALNNSGIIGFKSHTSNIYNSFMLKSKTTI